MYIFFINSRIKVCHTNCAFCIVTSINKNNFRDPYFAFFFRRFFSVIIDTTTNSHGSVSATYCSDFTAVNSKCATITTAPITTSTADTCSIFTTDGSNNTTINSDTSAIISFTTADTCTIYASSCSNDTAVNNKRSWTIYSCTIITFCNQFSHSFSIC